MNLNASLCYYGSLQGWAVSMYLIPLFIALTSSSQILINICSSHWTSANTDQNGIHFELTKGPCGGPLVLLGRKDDFVCNSNGLVQLYSVGFCLYPRQLASHRRQTIWQVKLIGYKICINSWVHGSKYCMKWILSLLVEDTWTEKPLTDKMRFGKKDSLLWPSEF